MTDLKTLFFSAPAWSSTGYGKQTNAIVSHLIKNGYDVKVRGTTLKGDEITWINQDGIEIQHLPNIMTYTHLDDSMTSQIRRLGINTFISLFDAWIVGSDLVRNLTNSGVTTVFYVPIDCETIPIRVLQTIRESSLIITMSQFGLKLVNQVRGMPPSIYIPHSYDTNVFKPYPRTRNPHKFVIGQVKTNSGERPNWPGLFESFRWFVEETGLTPEELELHLHSNPNPGNDSTTGMPVGYNLPILAEFYNIREYVTFPLNWGHTLQISDEQMAKELYSQIDVLVNPTVEGHGCPTIESQLCGIPALVVDEVGGQVENVPPEARIPIGWKLMTPNMARRPLIDPEKCKNMLVQLYEDENYKKQLARKGREIALQYDHSKILPRWNTVMEQIKANKDSRELLKWGSWKPTEEMISRGV